MIALIYPTSHIVMRKINNIELNELGYQRVCILNLSLGTYPQKRYEVR